MLDYISVQHRCSALGLEYFPVLGIYSQDQYQLLDVLQVNAETVEMIPGKLVEEVQRKELSSMLLSYCTVVTDASRLADYSEASVNILYHSYAFYDAEPGQEHKLRAPMAVYLPEAQYSNYANRQIDRSDHLLINPNSIFEERCLTEIHLHPRDGLMCCSPDNAKVQVNPLAPVSIIYTLCLIPYKGSIVRGNITRHLLVTSRTSPLTQEVLLRLTRPECGSLLHQLRDSITSPETAQTTLLTCFHSDPEISLISATDYLAYWIWVEAGKPLVQDYGRGQWVGHLEMAGNQGDLRLGLSKSWVRRMVLGAILDLIKWILIVT